ncbi:MULTISPECIES: hypothetical protein [unclassified Frankia]|uniref:hypothetical protein n=1 Tax=unclassified Frankia TaxID=2632575 RepID=UPI0007072B7B|nr:MULTISPECIES: hypothetical protein [unclassified Frankia]KQM05190.1 hypothetical protein FF86_101831 [Frankia sp. CpI1-P]
MATIDDGTTGRAGSTATGAAGTAQRVALATSAAASAAARTDQYPVRQSARQRRAASSRDPYIRGTAATGAVATVEGRGPTISPGGVPLTACHTAVGAAEAPHGALSPGGSVVLSARPARRRAVSTLTGDIDLQNLT